jgi:T4 superinfection immunity protein
MTFMFLMVVLYFLPAIIAHNKRDSSKILVVNLLFGWTVVGWCIALVWACAAERHTRPVLVPAGMVMATRCRCGAMEPAAAHFCWSCGRRL